MQDGVGRRVEAGEVKRGLLLGSFPDLFSDKFTPSLGGAERMAIKWSFVLNGVL